MLNALFTLHLTDNHKFIDNISLLCHFPKTFVYYFSISLDVYALKAHIK